MRAFILEVLDVNESQTTDITKILMADFFNLSVTEPLIRVNRGSLTHTGISFITAHGKKLAFQFVVVLYTCNTPNKPAYMNHNMYFCVPMLPGFVTYPIEILCTQNALHNTWIHNGSHLMLTCLYRQ